jgi:hypothetical protein
MEAIIECAAGLDVHQATVVACVVATGVGRKVRKEIRTLRNDDTGPGLLAGMAE